MIKKLIGIIAAAAVIVVIVITVMHRDKFKSLVLPEAVETPAASVTPEPVATESATPASVTSAPPHAAASAPVGPDTATSAPGGDVDSLR